MVSTFLNLAEILAVNGIIYASTGKLGAFHEKVGDGIQTVATGGKRRY
jgi:hypothetical protein